MDIRFLGTSFAVPTVESGNSSFVVSSGSQVILFEAGNDPIRWMMVAGIEPLSVSAVVLSHYHADHVTCFPGMISTYNCIGRSSPLTVIAPPETAKRLGLICALLDLSPDRVSFPVEYVEEYENDDLSISLYPAHHTVPSAMVRCAVPGASFLYTGDTEYHGDTAQAARGCDAMIHDASTTKKNVDRLPGHSCPFDAGRSAKAAGVRTLFLTHLNRDDFGDYLAAEAEARRSFGGKVLVPELLKPYAVSRGQKSIVLEHGRQKL